MSEGEQEQLELVFDVAVVHSEVVVQALEGEQIPRKLMGGRMSVQDLKPHIRVGLVTEYMTEYMHDCAGSGRRGVGMVYDG